MIESIEILPPLAYGGAIGGFRAMQDATERAVALRQAADNQALVTQMLRLTDAGARG